MASLENNVLDDPLAADGNSTFVGGQYSSVSAQTIQANGFSEAKNMNFDSFGMLNTRRGAKAVIGNTATLRWEDETSTWDGSSKRWGETIPDGAAVDSLFYFDTDASEYILAAVYSGGAGSIYQATETSVWGQISGSSYSGNLVYFAQLNNRVYYCDATNALKYIDSAVANQSISAGRVTSIKITTQGIGYTSVPAITFSSGTATATAVLGYGGKVVSATVTAAGSGYSATTPPTISFAAAPAGGTTAVGIANISQVPSKPKYLVSHTNRLFCASADTTIPPDTLYASDLLDGESWDLAGSSVRVGGDGDPITGLFSWFGNNILVFKQRSVWMVVADPTQTANQWTITLINSRIGCVGHDTIQPVGSDIFFMSRDGVRSISQIEAGTQTEVGLPISAPIQDIIDNLDLTYSDYFCSAYFKNLYMIGVVTSGNTRPNYVLVWNQLLRAWAGYWTGWAPRDFVVTAFSGRLRLTFADNTGHVWTWDEYTPITSETILEYRDGDTAYESYVITRGYQNGEPLVKKRGYMVQIETSNLLQTDAVTAYFSYEKDLNGTFTSLNSSISLTANTDQIPLAWNLIPAGKYRTVRFKFGTTSGKVALNNVALAAFADALVPSIT